MKSKTLALLMRLAVLFVAVCGGFACLYAIPTFGKEIVTANPEFAGWYRPWLAFAWLFALPCFAVLFEVWRVSGAVRDETVFTLQTAGWVRSGAVLLLSDAAILFVGNVVLFLLGMDHPGVVLLSVVLAILETAAALFAAVLSRCLTRAAALQEESDGTL